jgi:anhydro-N-acetylmuramic acid kinase
MPETKRLAALHRVLGEHQALAVRQLLEHGRVPAREVMAVGCSGVSLWHDSDGRYPSTLSLGMSAVVAERTGLTVMSDFSSRDIAVGGHGLPLTAIVDAMLFHDEREHRVLVHLGSVANVVSLPGQLGHAWRNVLGFQAGPCTMLLDGLMRLLTNGRESFDAGGKHAVQGRCLEPLLERWMQNHFFQKRPPKCVPCWEFGPEFLNRAVEQAKRIDGNLHDVLCTMTHFVARAIVHALQTHLPTPPTRVLVSGRGVRNGFLWRLLEQMLAATPLEKIDAHGLESEARQAVAHAGLAALSMDGVPVNLPAVTGASGLRLLGTLTPGDAVNWNRCLAWMARQAAPMQSAAA